MNNRRTAPGRQMAHMLSTILAKVTNIEQLLAPAIHNLPDSVSGITIGGKALGKTVAINQCTSVVYRVARIMHALHLSR